MYLSKLIKLSKAFDSTGSPELFEHDQLECGSGCESGPDWEEALVD